MVQEHFSGADEHFQDTMEDVLSLDMIEQSGVLCKSSIVNAKMTLPLEMVVSTSAVSTSGPLCATSKGGRRATGERMWVESELIEAGSRVRASCGLVAVSRIKVAHCSRM